MTTPTVGKGVKKHHFYIAGGGVFVGHWKTGCQLFNKQTNMQLPYDPAICSHL